MAVRGVVAIDPMVVQASDEWYDEFIEELEELFQAKGDARADAIRAANPGWNADDLEGKIHAQHAMSTRPIAGIRDQNPMATWIYVRILRGIRSRSYSH